MQSISYDCIYKKNHVQKGKRREYIRLIGVNAIVKDLRNARLAIGLPITN